MTADMVALKCKDCGTWLKWCPKDERQFYMPRVEKDQRIDCTDKIKSLEQENTELKKKLENAIIPKFKIGQEVWYVWNKNQLMPFRCVVDRITYDSSKYTKIRYDTSDEYYVGIREQALFATKEEAEQKLAEIKGEKDE